MSGLDWLILGGTLLFIVGYGTWRTRRAGESLDGYLLGGRQASWWAIGLSIMATQASAITFLSTPGQAYDDGMRFIQFYLGLPVAMVLIAIFVVPIYHRLKVFKANEKDPKFWNLLTEAKIRMKMKDYKGTITAAEQSKKLALDAKNADYVKMNEDLIMEAKKAGKL